MGRDQVRAYLVDDVPELRRIIRDAIEQDGRICVVGEAGDPDVAVHEIGALHPDVVVLDLAMPRKDGLELLPLIRGVAPETCVVVFSGFTSDRMARIALAHGADHYVQKGADLKFLGQVVEHCRTVTA